MAGFSSAGEAPIGPKPRIREDGLPLCWTRGGLSVTTLADEFADPAWVKRGKYRSLLQFIMNWNNWPDEADRSAMLDGPPPDSLTMDEKARIAAVVHCLCDRDGWPIPEWVHELKARRRGVSLIRDTYMSRSYMRHIRRRAHRIAKMHRVWLEPGSLSKT